MSRHAATAASTDGSRPARLRDLHLGLDRRPKGVEVSHGALMNLVDWHNEAFGISDADRASQVASVAFDASVWETWPYLAAGAELHIADDDDRASPAALVGG